MRNAGAGQVLILGAGLSGLTAARDLSRADLEVTVLEAAGRPGGRIDQATLPDGRIVQLGGEVVGRDHEAYLGLVAELGLGMEPGYAAIPGSATWDLAEQVAIADDYPWLDDREQADLGRVSGELAQLIDSLDPGDPLAHSDAKSLDQQSLGQWLHEIRALPSTLRIFELYANALNQGVTDRISLLSFARLRALFREPFDLRVEGGSARLIEAIADQLGERVEYGRIVDRIDIAEAGGVEVHTADGATVAGAAVICTIPARPLRAVEIEGLSDARLCSLRRQRHAIMAKLVVTYERSFWHDSGASGMAYSESAFSNSFQQQEGVLSLMITPEKMGHYLSAPSDLYREELTTTLARWWGCEAHGAHAYLERDWSLDPFTLGGIATYAPGDITSLGRLHGSHEPPFFVAGSDHWWAGYMEGAVRTAREAADEVIRYLS